MTTILVVFFFEKNACSATFHNIECQTSTKFVIFPSRQFYCNNLCRGTTFAMTPLKPFIIIMSILRLSNEQLSAFAVGNEHIFSLIIVCSTFVIFFGVQWCNRIKPLSMCNGQSGFYWKAEFTPTVEENRHLFLVTDRSRVSFASIIPAMLKYCLFILYKSV